MTAFLGHTLILFALAMALCGIALALFGATARDPEMLRWARGSAYLMLALVAGAVAVMIIALVTHDFSVKYVSEVGSTTTPLYYTVISLWAALEGSILFWALLLALYTAAFLAIYRDRYLDLQPWITAALLSISAFFLFVIVGPGNPFVAVNPPGPAAGCPATGCGPNPLLQNHPMMGLHPPLLYLGYVGLSVPFAVAIASLITRQTDTATLRLIRRWALLPWVFLSLGIVAGMWWSYAVLGWGGYWSWDPVENASVMPWLVTTAFLHSLQVQERRRMLKTWTYSLIIAAFLLSVFGTFLTRSGVLASVHSFTQSGIGPIFLAFFALYLIGSLALLFGRSPEMAAPGTLDAAVCRETAFLFNNLVLVAITFTILLGTIFPLIAEALQGSQLSVGAPYFNHIVVPMGFALLFLMGVGPVLPWGGSRLDEVQWRLLRPVALGCTAILLLLLLGVRGVGALATFGLAVFVLAVTLGRPLADIRTRQGNTGEAWPPAAWRLLRSNPRRFGGYLAHIGVLLIVVGIASSQAYGVRASATLRPGQSLSIDGYTVTFRGYRAHFDGRRMVLAARMEARRGGESLGSFLPSQNIYPTLATPVVTPAVREEPFDMLLGVLHGRSPLLDLAQLAHGRNPFEDLYLVLTAVGTTPANRTATVLVLVNPLVGLIWLGGMVLGLGGAYALTPALRRRRAPAVVAEPARLAVEEAPV
jgi:cytochrome c-type biogenesis protein CcmF